VSLDLIRKLGLETRPLCFPYNIEWFNNSGKAKVTHSTRIHFSVGSYHDYADFDVVPVEACSLLLGRPWEYDGDAAHQGRTNTYTFTHKGQDITLLPLSPAAIRKHFNDLAENNKKEPSDTESSDVRHEGIKLKGGAFLATTSAQAELCANLDAPCYTMLTQDVSFANTPMSISHTLHRAVPNLLQENDDVKESRTTQIQEGG
jgi:hypothetical protein